MVSFFQTFQIVIFNGKIDILLLFIPLSIISYSIELSSIITFSLSILSLVPLANKISFVTEELTKHTNNTIGGLLNATFGNAPELILSIVSLLNHGMVRFIQVCLIGSIISNMLLALGFSLVIGGLYHKEQKFKKISGQINAPLLMSVLMIMTLPSVMKQYSNASDDGLLLMSRICSIFLLICYVFLLYFVIISHNHIFNDDERPNENLDISSIKPELGSDNNLNETLCIDIRDNNNNVPVLKRSVSINTVETTETNDDKPILTLKQSIFWMTILTVIIAVISEFLSDSISKLSNSVSVYFLSGIIISIAGNVIEHYTAVLAAIDNKIDITTSITIGSATQIGMMVFPVITIVGWIANINMSMTLEPFELICFLFSCIIVGFILNAGKSNWLSGNNLLLPYAVFVIGFVIHYNEDL